MKLRYFDEKDYDIYVDRFIELSKKRNKTISYGELRYENLPDARWFVKHCPDDSVKSWGAFIDWCGFYAKGYTSKERAIKLIYKKANETDHPLYYDDFRDSGCYDVPIAFIRKTWGTMNRMKQELGLEINQGDMVSKSLTVSDLDNYLFKIKKYVDINEKPYITKREINDIDLGIKTNCLNKWCKKYYNKTLSERLCAIGVKTGKCGDGTVYKYDDGEVTKSQFEYLWSEVLRKCGLKYNIDYFRDVKYSSFIDGYCGYMNCDYVLKYNNKTIYIEIPGIIEAYKEWYYLDKTIPSKSKDNYKAKLKEKESMLKQHNCEYYLLFPCDITYENLKKILVSNSSDLRLEIEQYHKHNIEWNVVNKIGELKYTVQKSRDGQYKVDYSFF